MSFSDRVAHLFAFAERRLGETVTYTPARGAPVEIIAVVNREDQKQDGAQVSQRDARITINKSAVAAPKYRDRVTIAGVVYIVEQPRKNMSVNFWELDLRKDEKLVY